MKTIPSFTIDHTKLLPGVYVSSYHNIGEETITTFDLRITQPYKESVLTTGAIHAIEHIGATYLRNKKNVSNAIVYFGPMGCRTGFYLLISQKTTSLDIIPLLIETFEYIMYFQGDIPGATEAGCGNCYDMDLAQAKQVSKNYLQILKNIKPENMTY